MFSPSCSGGFAASYIKIGNHWEASRLHGLDARRSAFWVSISVPRRRFLALSTAALTWIKEKNFNGNTRGVAPPSRPLAEVVAAIRVP